MSTENNLNVLFDKSVKILTDLIAFKTISGEDNNSLIDYCDNILKKLGATSFRTFDEDKKRVNLFATIKSKKTNNKKPIILSGHTDVVPVSKGWSTDPFKATIKEDKLYGRGSCDMKGFIACTLAFAPIFSKSNLDRDIHFSFTFDEETACQGAPILIKELKKIGATSFRTFDEDKKRVNLFATIKSKKTSNKKPIILSGHTDVVPVSKGWSTDPFKATIKGDKLYGRGSCDMKGFIACTLAFAPIYSKSNLDRDIQFFITFDEETSC